MLDLIHSLKAWGQTLSTAISKHLFGPGYKQTPGARRVFVILVGLLALILGLKALALLGAWIASPAGTVQEGERLIYAADMSARFRVAIPVLGLGLGLSWLGFQVIDRTRSGERLLHWTVKDTESSESAKVMNGGLIYAAIILGVFIVLAQVIR
jgi:hypothetical protein